MHGKNNNSTQISLWKILEKSINSKCILLYELYETSAEICIKFQWLDYAEIVHKTLILDFHRIFIFSAVKYY